MMFSLLVPNYCAAGEVRGSCASLHAVCAHLAQDGQGNGE